MQNAMKQTQQRTRLQYQKGDYSKACCCDNCNGAAADNTLPAMLYSSRQYHLLLQYRTHRMSDNVSNWRVLQTVVKQEKKAD